MTNNTIHNVPRELLERAVRIPTKASVEENHAAIVDRGRAQSELRALLSAPSPAGVDGLEVVAWVTTGFSGKSRTRRAFTVNADDAARQHTNWTPHYRQVTTDQLCRLSDAQAIIDGLRGEVEALLKRAKTAEREAESALKTYKGLEKVARVVSDNSDQVCGEINVMRQERDRLAQRMSELEAAMAGISERISKVLIGHAHIDDLITVGKELDALSAVKAVEA